MKENSDNILTKLQDELDSEKKNFDCKKDFLWTNTASFHNARRKAMLDKYPEIQNLFGWDIWETIFCSLTIIFQFLINYYVCITKISWIYVIIITYVVSALMNHSLFLAMHEATHRSLLPYRWMNDFLAICTNMPMGVPAAVAFKRYHIDHHVGIGIDGFDMDIPTEFEAKFFQTKLGKLIFILIIPLTYTLRPIFIKPKHILKMEVLNWFIVICSDILILYYGGAKCLFYFLGGSLMGMSIHPVAGHFIAEHYFVSQTKLQETYSYYGIGNLFSYNAGYHVEHHDFPLIPGRKLPLLHKIAKEYYQDLSAYQSWTKVLYDFVMDDQVTCYNRIKRTSLRNEKILKEKKN